LILALPILLTAQEKVKEKVKQKEIGLAFYGLTHFGFTYRKGNTKSVCRLSALIASGEHSETDYYGDYMSENSFSCGFQIGREFRKPISDNLEFRYGMDLTFFYSYSIDFSNRSNNSINYSRSDIRIRYEEGLDLIFGLNYVLNKKFIVGVEILPSINYFKTKNNWRTNYSTNSIAYSGISYGLSTTSAMVSFCYRIIK